MVQRASPVYFEYRVCRQQFGFRISKRPSKRDSYGVPHPAVWTSTLSTCKDPVKGIQQSAKTVRNILELQSSELCVLILITKLEYLWQQVGPCQLEHP